MVESRFPIVSARQELGFIPTTAVRADIDVRTGGAEIGRAITGAGLTLLAIRRKRQEMTDANSSVQADDLRRLADEEFETFKLVNPQDTWEEFRLKQTGQVAENISKLSFSPRALSRQQAKSESYGNISVAGALTDATRQLRKETIVLQTNALTAAFRKQSFDVGFGKRPDGTLKGKGFLGALPVKGGGVATEFSIGVKLEANDGKETTIPTLVPTLTTSEIALMVDDIIPNNKPIPNIIMQKAIAHANKRVREGKSPFAENGEPKIAEAIRRFINNGSNMGMSKEVILLNIKAAREAGEKLRNKDAVTAKRNQASLDPTGVEVQMKAERELRATGKVTPELVALTDEDLIDIQKFAVSAQAKKDDDSKIAVNAAIEDSYGKIRDGATNIDAMIDAIAIDPIIADEDSITAAEKIKTFFSTWHSAVDVKVITPNSTRIEALKIKDAVLDGSITRDVGLEQYEKLEQKENRRGRKINPTDNKAFIESIFTAGRAAQKVEKQRQNAVLKRREKQLRDSIEKQPNLFLPDLATEILKDFANVAVIELHNKFREGDFTDDEVKTEVDRLMIKFTLSEVQQLLATEARRIRLAETLQEQQESITRTVEILRREGKIEEAKAIMDEAISLGIFEIEGEIPKKKKGKKKANISQGLLDRMLEPFR